MKTKYFAFFAGLALVTAGCVHTVSGNRAGAVPFVRDRMEGRYERSPDEVYKAAHDVLQFNGVITAESNITSTNTVRALEGKVNTRRVWIRVEQVDPKLTSVMVQARTKWGGSDLDLVHELDKEIALKLSH